MKFSALTLTSTLEVCARFTPGIGGEEQFKVAHLPLRLQEMRNNFITLTLVKMMSAA
jgi:hypothetical protein